MRRQNHPAVVIPLLVALFVAPHVTHAADVKSDKVIIEPARETAEWLLATQPEAAAAHLARWLGARAEFIRA